jgi:hypothetical protein
MVKSFAPLPGGGFMLTWDTVAGKTYRVERSASLGPADWTTLEDGIPGDGSPRSFSDLAVPAAPRIFYRIAVEAAAGDMG